MKRRTGKCSVADALVIVMSLNLVPNAFAGARLKRPTPSEVAVGAVSISRLCGTHQELIVVHNVGQTSDIARRGRERLVAKSNPDRSRLSLPARGRERKPG